MKFSGSFEKLYAPKCRIVLSNTWEGTAGFLALAIIDTPTGLVRIGAPNTIQDYAQILYRAFRKADHMGLTTLVIVPPNGEEIGLAIRERIEKAARGR
jgi:L-threonylcarbamoyladenylate synthase